MIKHFTIAFLILLIPFVVYALPIPWDGDFTLQELNFLTSFSTPDVFFGSTTSTAPFQFFGSATSTSNLLLLQSQSITAFTVTASGTGAFTGDLTISGDDLFMATNTDTFLLIADGTNFNPVIMSDDATITNAGVISVVDLTCTDCINATEIEDIYLLDDGDIGTGVFDFGGATSFEIPNGTGNVVDTAGECAVDTSDGQLVCFDGTNTLVFDDVLSACTLIENLAAADDNIEILTMNDAWTLTGWATHCRGTCTTTASTQPKSRLTNVNTTTPLIGSATGTSVDVYDAITANNSIAAGDALIMDVTNTPNPETDEYNICYTLTKDRQ